jgi:hypothetical protein
LNLLRLLQTVDRRVLYALLLLAVTVPFFVPMQLPVVPSPETKALYASVEALPPGSFVLVGVDWSAGTRGENGPHTTALLRHLMRRHLRFALLCFSDPQGKTLGEETALQLQPQFGYHEGADWVNLGYQIGTNMDNYLKAFVLDIPAVGKTDIHGTPLSQLPAMAGIHTARDIRLLVDITPTGSYQHYIQFVQGPYGDTLKMGAMLTAVMAPEAYNYLDSKQLAGLAPGLEGAAEYEALYARQYDPGAVRGSRVTQYSNSSSFAHLLIIAFIGLGNVAMLLERRQKRLGRAGG